MKLFWSILFVALLSIPSYSQTTYYVSASGNDSNDGLTESTTWKTPLRVRFTAYSPGDSILFKRGDVFYGELCDTLVGTADNPIVVGAYGTGDKPIIYGNCQDLVWTKSWANDSVYQLPIGIGTRTWVYPSQFVNGEWIQAVFDPPSVRGSDPGTWDAFLDGMTDGVMAHSLGNDTLFYNPYGSINPAATGWDSLKIHRTDNRIFDGSAHYIIRDLDIRWFSSIISISGDSGLVRNVDGKWAMGNGLQFIAGATDCIIDSSSIDSTGNTGQYFIEALRCTFRYSTVTNAGMPKLTTASEYGMPVVGVDRTAIGILDHYSAAGSDKGYNLVHNVTMTNCWGGFFDYFYAVGDTMRDNVGVGGKGSGSPFGADLVVVRNHLTNYPDSGGNGFTVSLARAGNILIEDNTLLNVRDYGLKATSTDSAGVITFNRNYVDMRIISPRDFVLFVDTSASTIVSTNNTFIGGYVGIQGAQKFTLNGNSETNISIFQSTGYEVGSRWKLIPIRDVYILIKD